MKPLNRIFQYCKTFLKSIEPLSRNRDPHMTQNEHVYAICCRQEVGDDVISSRNAKTVEGYVLVHFEVASSFRDIPKNHFMTDIDDSIKRKRFRVSL